MIREIRRIKHVARKGVLKFFLILTVYLAINIMAVTQKDRIKRGSLIESRVREFAKGMRLLQGE